MVKNNNYTDNPLWCELKIKGTVPDQSLNLISPENTFNEAVTYATDIEGEVLLDNTS